MAIYQMVAEGLVDLVVSLEARVGMEEVTAAEEQVVVREGVLVVVREAEEMEVAPAGGKEVVVQEVALVVAVRAEGEMVDRAECRA
jgi:hypothetical protein